MDFSEKNVLFLSTNFVSSLMYLFIYLFVYLFIYLFYLFILFIWAKNTNKNVTSFRNKLLTIHSEHFSDFLGLIKFLKLDKNLDYTKLIKFSRSFSDTKAWLAWSWSWEKLKHEAWEKMMQESLMMNLRNL